MFILHYSGTGNSAYIAKQISNRMGAEMLSLNDVFRKNIPVAIPDDTLVFVTPTYCWRLPRVVSDWMEKQQFHKGQKVYFVMTCGDDFGNAEQYLNELCSRIGVECMGGIEVVMPENYIALFTAPSVELSRTIVECADLAVVEVCQYLERGEHFPERPVNFRDKIFSGITNSLFFSIIVKDKKFYAKDSCVGCGVCEEVCPKNNVRLVYGKPTWNGNCTHCMACICRCPQEAIEYGKGALGKRRYVMEGE